MDALVPGKTYSITSHSTINLKGTLFSTTSAREEFVVLLQVPSKILDFGLWKYEFPLIPQ